VYMIYRAVGLAFSLYEFIILLRVLMTWINLSPYSTVGRFLCDLADPFLGFFERFMPRALLTPLNFTPVVALIALSFIQSIVMRLLAAIL
jgi:YggT family protein